MSLDNAQFISELSITDPPGTDAVAEGDDHIRTTKRATQQSFPNVNAAVPQTAAQMGQMAIKNEVNTFTIQQLFNAGTSAAPGVAFSVGANDGMFQVSAGLLGFSTLGSTRFTIESSRIRFTPPLRPDNDGTAVAPQYSFFNNSNMGMFRAGASQLGFAVNGVEQFRVSNAVVSVLGTIEQIRNTDGLDATPAYSFNNAPNTGMLRGTGGALNFTVLGTRRLQITPAGSRFGFRQDGATGGVSLSMENSAGVIGYSIDYEGTGGFQPGQFSISRFNRTTGAFIDIPLYINATTGRVHSLLPILSP